MKCAVFGCETKYKKTAAGYSVFNLRDLGNLREQNWQECFQKTNDWFDVMIVRTPYVDLRCRLNGKGIAVNGRNKILDEMSELVKKTGQ